MHASTVVAVADGSDRYTKAAIFHKVYEPLVVLIHGARPLLKVQELLLLAVHEAITDVVPLESLTELGPRHLVAIRKGGGEGCPPGTHGPTELLG
jgi:hypothetical protein